MTHDLTEMTVDVDARRHGGSRLLVPTGFSTPHEICSGVDITGGDDSPVGEATTGQPFRIVTPTADTVTVRYTYRAGSQSYPDTLFIHRPNRFTTAAEALVQEARAIATHLSGQDRLRAIATATADRFTYGHPERRFNDGLDHVPALGCGIAEGSCVDINTYFIATLRAAGFDAGYVAGCFFPAEKGGRCDDMHCWVVTRDQGEVLEWDVAHHLKLGLREIAPGLNPKPGYRVALSHSMGLAFPVLRVDCLKLAAEPVWIDETGDTANGDLVIRSANRPAPAMAVT